MRYRFTVITWRNAAWLPFVVLVRIPVMTTLFVIQALGEAAERLGDTLGAVLPGIEKKRIPVKGLVEPRLCPKPEKTDA